MLKKIALSLSILLTGCQTLKPIQPTQPQQEQLDNFAIQGKIGVRTPEQSGSAFYTWIQQQEQFEIELSGILGIGKTQIQGKTGDVSLQNAQVGTIHATTPEELLYLATGWIAPISSLKYWVQAQTHSNNAQIEYDAQHRPIQINEQNWLVHLDYNEQNTKPYRLILNQTTDNGQQNRITMIIQNR